MKTLQKLLAAVLVIALAACVGCADNKTPDAKTPDTKTPAAHNHDHDDDHDDAGKTPAGENPEQTDPQQTEPMNEDGPDLPTPAENPDVDPVDDAESGSTEKKGGVDINE